MMNKSNTILVFGGSGFVGISLVKHLLNSGYNSVCIADINAPREELIGFTYYSCDITSAESVCDTFESCKPSVVYNLAGFANLDLAINFPKQTMELNVMGNINLLDAAVKYNIDLFVYASSAYAMSDKGSFYGISKLASEKIVQEFGKKFDLDFSILRYGSIYAAEDFNNNYLYQLVKSAIKSGTIIHNGDGEEIREYVHVNDVSELSVQVMEKKSLWNIALMLTGNERMKRNELFQMIREIIGNDDIKIQYINGDDKNHYRYTPYSFQGSSAKKIIANPHFDMGQGILECVKHVMETEE